MICASVLRAKRYPLLKCLRHWTRYCWLNWPLPPLTPITCLLMPFQFLLLDIVFFFLLASILVAADRCIGIFSTELCRWAANGEQLYNWATAYFRNKPDSTLIPTIFCTGHYSRCKSQLHQHQLLTRRAAQLGGQQLNAIQLSSSATITPPYRCNAHTQLCIDTKI